MFVNVPALVGIALGTLLSEDLATIAAGGLVREGQSTFWLAAAACVVGVYVGDLGLWLAGRVLGRRVLTLPSVAKQVSADTIDRLAGHLDRRLGAAVLLSRFVPGSRLPMYLAAGAVGQRPVAFAAWSLVAVSLWTPLLLWTSLSFGTTLASLVVGDMSTVVHQLVGALGVLAALRVASRRLVPS
jgi:membrane protein DedA with SNARE-associated domain